ncbi:hypothetical protein NMY22_g1479 [Coprinellus aureogranulatus]|nr:hypothetical protein NMY22_g1479 [Coprinellus aureogranulatus]
MAPADLKRKFPSLSGKADEELLVDKERPVRRPEPPRLPAVMLAPPNANLQPLRPEHVIKPRERIAVVREKTKAYLARRREEDKIMGRCRRQPLADTPRAVCFQALPVHLPPKGLDKAGGSDDER